MSERGDFLGADGRVDVTRIMEHIRETLGHSEGLSPEVMEARAEKTLLAFAEESDVDPEFLSRLMAPGGGWNLAPDYRIETHRRGLAGWLVLWLKALARPLVRLYTDSLFRRQAQINLYLVGVCRSLAREIVRLESGGAPGRRDGPPPKA
ncbi:MAG TPA: hypothetical protein VN083_07010 [Vicinamibacteria bacterium]|nr:hypothetical protein [Vicinamibacteria bacterium]